MTGEQIIQGFVELLENKHIYGSIHIDLKPVEDYIENIVLPEDVARHYLRSFGGVPSRTPPSVKAITVTFRNKQKQNMIRRSGLELWRFQHEGYSDPPAFLSDENSYLIFTIPSIKIKCNFCDAIDPPHNSIDLDNNFNPLNLFQEKDHNRVQIFTFPYLCQACRKEPVIFFVRREGVKLRIVGRSNYEKVEVPKNIPKEEKKYFEEAIIAQNGGKILASIFYLRLFLELYMRRITGIKEKTRGDDLGEGYFQYLPDDFPHHKDTSMKMVWEKLSIPIHAGEGKKDTDEKLLNKSFEDIKNHFDLLEHFPITIKKKSKAKNGKSKT